MELIPAIEIGKKYLWTSGVVEMICPKCGYIFGTQTKGREEVVTVIAELPNTTTPVMCEECLSNLGNDYPGFYQCEVKGEWNYRGIPYTQLFPIEQG